MEREKMTTRDWGWPRHVSVYMSGQRAAPSTVGGLVGHWGGVGGGGGGVGDIGLLPGQPGY